MFFDKPSETLLQHEGEVSFSEQKAAVEGAYVWNTIAGLIMAFQSVIMLMVLMRVSDTVTAGVFTIAYANANLFLTVGKYGMRNYQVSDVLPVYSFGNYLVSRGVTSLAMVIGAFAYLAWSAASLDYTANKILVIAFMCLFKTIDSVEDVFFGNFQQNGRLDVAGRLLTMRLATTLVLFGVGTAVTGDLLVPLVASTVYSAIFFVCALLYARRRHDLPKGNLGWDFPAVGRLLKECFPLFLAAFLLFYIGNAPKYAIDACLGDVEQAYYGFIAMPVFVVGLFASFVYSPIIASLSRKWAEGDVGGFVKVFVRQIGYVVLITLACDTGAFVAGVPVLGWLYNVDLSPYLVELIVLVSGGGFLALTTLFTLGITILRRQKSLIWGYAGVGLAALALSPWFVETWAIAGASWEYIVLMALLAFWFGAVFVHGVRGHIRRNLQDSPSRR